MSTDRELLELAAKAAGIGGGWGDRVTIGQDEVDLTDIWFLEDPEYCASWNPLTDDGDALRLAVMLGITICPHKKRKETHARIYAGEYTEHYANGDYIGLSNDWYYESGEDPDGPRATRRAIVRAAAEIGRGRP